MMIKQEAGSLAMEMLEKVCGEEEYKKHAQKCISVFNKLFDQQKELLFRLEDAMTDKELYILDYLFEFS